ncbi:M56 family metallopeptidase [Bacteroides sp.]|uniref:M56 family metallopeptidase n=1 Tax=Bacteroides sp. TaxID=29523 RepID=UPI002615044A|nr:M56 family metallopeptidase [Bacteroides sp.]MDD3038971.1 M56 family metallopeptidase [Bacteroides sp.]
MGVFFIYVLKSAICLSLFYLFYSLLLSRETFYRFNRVALLGILFLSLSIPLIELTTNQQMEVHQAMQSIEQFLVTTESMHSIKVITTQPEDTSITWTQILLFVYLIGILFFICRNLYSLSRLLLLIKSGKRKKLERGIILIIHERKIAPFSWMKYIVISQKDWEEDGETILIHEMAHLHNRHSIDLFLVDACVFFQWFNPGAWLLKQELQNIHEYEADDTVIKEGIDVKEYQLLLIRKAVGTRLYSMANSFNHSKLKKRITMMLKEKSSPWAYLKYIYVLPLAAFAVTAFARPEISEKIEEISAVKVNDLATIIETKVEKISSNKDTLKQKIAAFPSHMPLAYSVDSLVISDESCVLYDPIINKMNGKKPLIIIDGKEIVGDDLLSKISKDSIASITVLQDKVALELYGEKGKDGVWLIQSIANQKPINALKKENAHVANVLNKMNSFRSGKGKNLDPKQVASLVSVDKEPLFIVDNKEVSQVELSEIPIDSISSISILKDESATSIYGEKGKDGVVLITLLIGEKDTIRKKVSDK